MQLGTHTSQLGSLGSQLGTVGSSIQVAYPNLIRMNDTLFRSADMNDLSFVEVTITGEGFTIPDFGDEDLES